MNKNRSGDREKKNTSPLKNIGILLLLIYTIIEVFIVKIKPVIAISILIISIILILAGGNKRSAKK